MWTLPTNAFTIRRIEQPLRQLVYNATGWEDFDRMSVQITSDLRVERDRRSSRNHVSVYNVFDGKRHEANVVEERDGNVSYWHRYASYWVGRLEPCEIFVYRQSHIISLYVHQLWLDDLMKAELEVARDAILEAPGDQVPPSAYKIAKELLPFGHGLFIALIRKERAG